MSESYGLLEDIFDRRVLNKYLRLLPKPYNLYYFFKKSDDELSDLFIFYINDSIIVDPKKISVDSKAYITGSIDLAYKELDDEDLDIIKDYIEEKVNSYNDKEINKKNILENLFSEKTHKLNSLEFELFELFTLRLLNREINISFLKVDPSFIGKGLAQYLMLLSCNYALHTHDIQKISLDDDTDNAWNLENNLYIKLGLIYINNDPEPEMEGYTKIICDNFNKFRIKYTDEKRILYNGSSFEPFFKPLNI